MERIQLMEFSQELSTPVESLLQPAFFEPWWLDGSENEVQNNELLLITKSLSAPATATAISEAHMATPMSSGQMPSEHIPAIGSAAEPTVSNGDSVMDDNAKNIELVSPQTLMTQPTPSRPTVRGVAGPTPPTPKLSLLEQLQTDQPLMDVISNKHKRGYYRCTHCPETFSNIFDYASHMDEFDIKREFKCPFVLSPWKILGLPRRPDLRRHCAIQHKDQLPADLKEMLNLKDETYPTLKCPHQYCDKVFYRKDAYNRHIAIVHEKLGSRFNKRMFQILADCPFDKEPERHRYVKTRMKNRRNTTNISNTNARSNGGSVQKRGRRHSIAIAGIH